MIEKFEAQCPDSVKEFLASMEFWAEVQQRYTELDVDKNGVVEPEELFPIIIELTNSEPWAVTDTHCRKFAQIFDTNGDGKINMKEFENLVRFTVIMSAMDEQVELELDSWTQFVGDYVTNIQKKSYSITIQEKRKEKTEAVEGKKHGIWNSSSNTSP